MAKKLRICETVLRDGHQSILATRMRYEQMEPVLGLLDEIGYEALECWGGATYDSCLRFLNEDPWERLRKLKANVKNTPLQMLLRGQNLLGYKHYSDDVVEAFCKAAVKNGIDRIRIFDALNDPRNMEAAIKYSKKAGAHVQSAMVYTISPVHTTESFLKVAETLVEMGTDSLCIKDMAGLLLPKQATELVEALKKGTKLPIEMHTHYTTGMASMTYLKAIEAGADIIDTASTPFAMGTSQPSTDVMVAALQGTEYDTGLDLDKLIAISNYFQPYREECIKSGLLSTKVLGVDVKALKYQVPGGMLSNLISQLHQAGKDDKLQEVLEEVPRVRKDFGEPPLVTPSSQIVGTQAVMNVIAGERYKMVPKESYKLVAGEFGKTVKPMNPEVVEKILKGEKQMTDRPADHIAPQLKKFEEEAKEWTRQPEDVLSYALFPQVAKDFFEYRNAQSTGVALSAADKANKAYPV